MYFLNHNDLSLYQDNTAVVYQNNESVLQTLKYYEVLQRSEIICSHLSKHIVNKHVCVGLVMRHNVHIPSIILSLQKLQHTFVFMEPTETDENGFILKETQLKWIITYDETCDISMYKCSLILSLKISATDHLYLWQNDSSLPEKCFKNICYAIQTSGTTGKKKIVYVENECILSNVKSLRKLFHVDNGDKVYFGTPLTFDPSMIELFLTMMSGATLVIIPHKCHINPPYLLSALFNKLSSITILQMPPSLFLRWNETDLKFILQKTSLRILALGGEPFPETILNIEKSSNLKIFNLYGITEVSCWASAHEVDENSKEIYLGQPLNDTFLSVRNDSNANVTNGVGELYIESYVRICHVTEIKQHPQTFIATGDLVQINNTGIKYLGRVNNMIKRFGHRVDLHETENTILKCTNIQSKCVWHECHKKLLLFLLIKEFDPFIKCKIVDKLRVKLLHILPKPSFPDYIDIVSQFPLTENGKVDHKTLSQMYEVDTKKTNLPPSEIFSMLWCKYFGLSHKTLSKYKKYNFFEMGGNSILIIQFKNELCDNFNCDIPSKFLSLLYEESYEFCEKYITNYKITRKRTIEDQNKIVSEEAQILTNQTKILNVMWTCDLKACVDCSPVALKLNFKTLIAVGSFSNIFGIYHADTGEEYCKFVLPGSVEKPPCVSVNCDKVFVGCLDYSVYCLCITSKKIIWTYKTDDIIKCTPCYCLKNTAIVCGSYDKNVYCLNEKTGKLIWKTPTAERLSSSPICVENIFIASLTGTCMCLKEDTGIILWTINTGNPIFGSPSFYLQNIIWPDVAGFVHGINIHNGHENWSFKSEGMIYSSIEKYEDFIFFGSYDHHVYCIEITETTCNLKFKVMVDSAVFATPTICTLGNKKYVTAVTVSGRIYLIDLCDHQICSTMALSNEVYSSPLCQQNQIYVGCRDNHLYCIKITE